MVDTCYGCEPKHNLFSLMTFPIRIKELGTRLNTTNTSANGSNSSSKGVAAVAALKETIKQVAVGPSHIAVLTESGQVGRFVFSINTDALDLNKPDSSKK